MKKENTFITECKECWKQDIWLKVLTITSVGLIISSFIVPPLGIIDGSVLAAVGELTGLGALWEFTKAMNKNIDAKVKIKEIELELNNKDILYITRLAYNSETQTIHIGNVSKTVTITVE